MTERIHSMTVPSTPAAGTVAVLAPFDQSVIAEVETSDAHAIDQALNTAYQLFRDRKQWLSVAQRIAILEKTVAIMTERASELAVAAAREGGKPLVDSQVEVARAIDSIRLCIDCLRTESSPMIPMGINAASNGKLAMTVHEPIGVVVAVSAFNHPLNLICHQVGPAIAAGCPVIVKPADDTPLSCFSFVSILREAGLPDAYCQAVLTSDLDVATALVTDQRVGFFSFIGSARVGWMLRSKLAAGTRCALEHGGAAPVIMDQQADLSQAIPKLAKGGFYHAGQVCVSVQRVFAHRSVAQTLAQQLAEVAQSLTIGDPTLAETDVGPLIRPAETNRIEQWVQEAIDEGAERLAGGHRLSDTSYACTVLLNPKPSSKVSTQEIFGPVICVYSYDEVDEAIAQANALPFAFQSSVFTDSIDMAMHTARQLDASAVMVNDHTAFRVDWMPFAGLRESGLGVGGIPHTLADMQIEKMIVVNSAALAE
jgi:acyl-CoA reductase-like NAD-dependent aldehyde dehydrogenase